MFPARFVEAENWMGFHADQEAVRALALSQDETRRGQAAIPGGKTTPGPRTVLRPHEGADLLMKSERN